MSDFIFNSYNTGPYGHDLTVDASGNLNVSLTAVSGRYAYGEGDTGRTVSVDGCGRLLVNLYTPSGDSLPSVANYSFGDRFYLVGSGFYNRGISGWETGGGGGGSTDAVDIIITDAGSFYPTDNVEAALQTAGQKNRDFTNASGIWIKTATGASGIIVTKSGSTLSIKEQMLIAKPFKTLTSAASIAIDLAQYNNYYLPLSHNASGILSNPTDGAKYMFVVKQMLGSKTLSFPNVIWPNGSAYTPTAASGSVDSVVIVYISTLNKYLGQSIKNLY